MNATQRLAEIENQIASRKPELDALHVARMAARTEPPRSTVIHPMLAAANLAPRTYKLVAQGDSWFDYPVSWDLIDWLKHTHGHDIDDLGVAGSTLNDIVYGPVPSNFLGIPQSSDVSRQAELINRIGEKQPDAVLLSGGGNDIAGPEFFSFINNALAGLQNPNQEVLRGVADQTFRKAYSDLIELIDAKGQQMHPGVSIPIFIHGYDYPWPDGRGFTMFNLVGPWFHDSFEQKNFHFDEGDANASEELLVRHNIVAGFIDAFNTMLSGLESQYASFVHYVDLRATLLGRDEWANELHPKREGFGKLADKINLALHKVLQ